MSGLFDDVADDSSAVISDCVRYRYRLTRTWSEKPPMAFVMLNPSKADAVQDDPTIRRCVGFARREGCGGIVVVNLYGLRSTDPAGLKVVDDPVGPENDAHIRAVVAAADLVVVAWGARVLGRERPSAVIHMIEWAGKIPWCFGVTASGEPRHPLMLRNDAALVNYNDFPRPI